VAHLQQRQGSREYTLVFPLPSVQQALKIRSWQQKGHEHDLDEFPALSQVRWKGSEGLARDPWHESRKQ
jgi:hypothetical protein